MLSALRPTRRVRSDQPRCKRKNDAARTRARGATPQTAIATSRISATREQREPCHEGGGPTERHGVGPDVIQQVRVVVAYLLYEMARGERQGEERGKRQGSGVERSKERIAEMQVERAARQVKE
jgi:hypothetical protein